MTVKKNPNRGGGDFPINPLGGTGGSGGSRGLAIGKTSKQKEALRESNKARAGKSRGGGPQTIEGKRAQMKRFIMKDSDSKAAGEARWKRFVANAKKNGNKRLGY